MNEPVNKLSIDELTDILSLSEHAAAIYTSERIIIQMATDPMLRSWGRDRSVIGMPLTEAIPEIKDQPFWGWLQNVWNTGISYEASEMPVQKMADGQLQTFYFDFRYRAVKNSANETYCILHTLEDVTEKRLSRMREQQLNEKLAATIEELTVSNEELAMANDELSRSQKMLQIVNNSLTKSEAMFRNMVEQAPIAIAVIKGPKLIFESVNAMMLKLLGKKADIIGKPYALALPEMENQPYLQLLKDVYTSGDPFYANEAKAALEEDGIMREGYFNFIYKPIKDENGIANTIVAVAMDVTEQVMARSLLQNQAKTGMEPDSSGLQNIHQQKDNL